MQWLPSLFLFLFATCHRKRLAVFSFVEGFRDDIRSHVDYGVDVSFPMHHANVTVNFDFLPHNVLPSLYPTPSLYRDMPVQPLGERNAVYNAYMKGCRDRYGVEHCQEYEEYRIAMNLQQPPSMMNYTDLGYQKMTVPASIWDPIRRFWDRNNENWKLERWPAGNTFVNHWKAPTYLVNIEDSSLRGGGSKLKQSIVDGATESMRKWTSSEELTHCSLYGIRVYTEGAILSSHVDRLPNVFSAVISVAQDLDQPWPLELIGHDGKAHNVTLQAGEMLLYESHSVIHGRPFGMNGRYVANLFLHFEPVGHSLKYHGHDVEYSSMDTAATQYRKAIAQGIGGHESAGLAGQGLPPYLVPAASSEKRLYAQPNPDSVMTTDSPIQTLAHKLAAEGRTIELIELIEEQEHLVHAKDSFGWTPLHEGARSGHMDVVKYLVEHGADIHERSHNGTGGNALFYAQQKQGSSSPVALFLESLGAFVVEPDPEL